MGGHRQNEAGPHRFDAAADGSGPAEGLLDPLSVLPGQGIAVVPRRVPIDGGLPRLPRTMRGDAGLPQVPDKVGAVITPVGPECRPPGPEVRGISRQIHCPARQRRRPRPDRREYAGGSASAAQAPACRSNRAKFGTSLPHIPAIFRQSFHQPQPRAGLAGAGGNLRRPFPEGGPGLSKYGTITSCADNGIDRPCCSLHPMAVARSTDNPAGQI